MLTITQLNLSQNGYGPSCCQGSLHMTIHMQGCVHPQGRKQNSSIANREWVFNSTPPLGSCCQHEANKKHLLTKTRSQTCNSTDFRTCICTHLGFSRAHGNAQEPTQCPRLMTCQLNNKSHTVNPKPKPSRSGPGPGPTHQPGTPPAPNHPLKLQH